MNDPEKFVSELGLTEVRWDDEGEPTSALYCDVCSSRVDFVEREADVEPIDVGLIHAMPMSVNRWVRVEPCGHWTGGTVTVTGGVAPVA